MLGGTPEGQPRDAGSTPLGMLEDGFVEAELLRAASASPAKARRFSLTDQGQKPGRWQEWPREQRSKPGPGRPKCQAGLMRASRHRPTTSNSFPTSPPITAF